MSRDQKVVPGPCKKTTAYQHAVHSVGHMIQSFPSIAGDPLTTQAEKVIAYLISTGWIHNPEAIHVHHNWEIELNWIMENAEAEEAPRA